MEDSKREPAGILYGVGTGPGDPELLTLKAVRILREADVIGIPSTKKEGCKAWQIAVQAVPEIEKKETLFVSFPMSRDPAVLERAHQEGAMQTAKLLDQGKSIAFLTLGDPSVYSTYCYLQKQIQNMGYGTVMVSGVPSFCAAAARLGISLGEQGEALHILPGSYPLEAGLGFSGTRVLMKSGKQIGAVKERLLAENCSSKMVENCGMPGERVIWRTEDIPEDAGYYSLIIVKDKEKWD